MTPLPPRPRRRWMLSTKLRRVPRLQSLYSQRDSPALPARRKAPAPCRL
ncbi:MAG: hypothetical protein ABFD92_11440 [Planctomycetaceae bacterium]|nr:hypothetical protein [Planctomycetaceae bacterium]